MKKLFCISMLIIMASCGKKENTPEVIVAKSELKKMNVSDSQISDYEFKVIEMSGFDAYIMASNKYEQDLERAKMTGNSEAQHNALDKISEYVDKGSKVKDLRFKVVKAFVIKDKDTLHKKFVFLDDKNNVVDTENIK